MNRMIVGMAVALFCNLATMAAGREWEDLSDFARQEVVSNLVHRHVSDFMGVFQCQADELYHMKEWFDEESDAAFRSLLLNAGRRVRIMRQFAPKTDIRKYGYVFRSEIQRALNERCSRGYRPWVYYSKITYFAVMKTVKDAREILDDPVEAEKASCAVEKGVAYKIVPGCCFEIEASPYQLRMEGWPDIEKRRVECFTRDYERNINSAKSSFQLVLVKLSKRELSEAVYCLLGKRRYNELLSGGSNPYLIEVAGGIPETQFARDIYSVMKANRAKKEKK